tara:strand:+ start:44479 stop:44865 length:387 start_codon:yes stop_codon:yes gene_type:complete
MIISVVLVIHTHRRRKWWYDRFLCEPTHGCVRDGRKNESMPLPVEEKQQIIKDFARKEGDSGSPEVQIALLTARIKQVATHLRQNKGDVHNRRGLVMMVSKRNRLLRYLSKKDHGAYLELIKKLGLRK